MDRSHGDGGRHVLLLSVDGLHQADLSWYVAHHPKSALAALVGLVPGMVAQATGGNTDTTGVYYDSSFNHALLPAGTTTCPAGAPTGADVEYAENLDRNQNSIDAGQGLAGLPGNLLALTGDPKILIDPAKLPVDPKTCNMQQWACRRSGPSRC